MLFASLLLLAFTIAMPTGGPARPRAASAPQQPQSIRVAPAPPGPPISYAPIAPTRSRSGASAAPLDLPAGYAPPTRSRSGASVAPLDLPAGYAPPTRGRSGASAAPPGGFPASASPPPAPRSPPPAYLPKPNRPEAVRTQHEQQRYDALPVHERVAKDITRYVGRNKYGVASAVVGGTGAILTATGVGAAAGIPLMAGGAALGVMQARQNYAREKASNPDMAIGNAVGAGLGAAATIGSHFIPLAGPAIAPFVAHGVQALQAGMAGGNLIASKVAENRHNAWIKDTRSKGLALPIEEYGKQKNSRNLLAGQENLAPAYDGGYNDEYDASYESFGKDVKSYKDVDSEFEGQDEQFESNDEDFEDQLDFEMDMDENYDGEADQDMEFEEEAHRFEEDAKFEFDSE